MTMEQGSTEQMVQQGDYLYVNCWSYNNRILKIDTRTDEIVAELKVGIQPNSLALDCHGNKLTSLDLAKNTALTTLDCGENAIATIYLGTEKLVSLDCANNALTSINVAFEAFMRLNFTAAQAWRKFKCTVEKSSFSARSRCAEAYNRSGPPVVAS